MRYVVLLAVPPRRQRLHASRGFDRDLARDHLRRG